MPTNKVKLKRGDKKRMGDTPVRRCSKKCYLFQEGGSGCRFYQAKQVEFGEPCLYDLHKMKQYSDAFVTGDNSAIKEDASRITAQVMSQIDRMLEQVNLEGVTIKEPIQDAKGNVVYIPDPNWRPEHGGTANLVPAMRVRDHPLLSRCIQLARSMGINLNDFKLTPKSADEKAMVSGRIVVENQENMAAVEARRDEQYEKFARAIEIGTAMTKQDPVYQQLMADEDVVR
jgi:hypothetical protein